MGGEKSLRKIKFMCTVCVCGVRGRAKDEVHKNENKHHPLENYRNESERCCCAQSTAFKWIEMANKVRYRKCTKNNNNKS